MKKKSLIIIGSGRVGKFCRDIAKKNELKVEGFLDDTKSIGEKVDDTLILGEIELAFHEKYRDNYEFILAIGDPKFRVEFLAKVKKSNITLRTLIHPNTEISSYADIGLGCVVLPYTSVLAGSKISEGVLIEDHCSIGVDVKIAKGTVIAPSVTITAASKIQKGCFVGTGTTIIPERVIGPFSVIGAMSCIIKDVHAYSLVVGVPAKVIKKLDVN